MNILKRLPFLLLAAVFAAGLSVSAITVQAADTTIVVLDGQKAVLNSDIGKKAQKAMEEKVKELQEKLKKDEDELMALQEEIEKKSSVWSEEKKQEKGIEFQKKRRDLGVKQDDAKLELKQLEEQQLGPIAKEMDKIVQKVAKENGYTIILPKQLVVYNDSAIEITEKVTQALNETAQSK